MSLNGILNVHKPEGKTSFRIVASLRHLSGEKHIGHAGTLDPIATGVLPICFGQATKVVQFLSDCTKTYHASIKLGATTDTYDREGIIVSRKDETGITVNQVEKSLALFRGTIEQIPPKYSAIKFQGRKQYELARAGIDIIPKPRQVTISQIKLINYTPPLAIIHVDCSKGTYIRSLAHDLGQYLGCGAYLEDLVRTGYGPFQIENSLHMSTITSISKENTWSKYLHPVDTPLLDLPAIVVDGLGETSIKNGGTVPAHNKIAPAPKLCRAYNQSGELIALLRLIHDKNVWQPYKVLIPG